MKNIENFGYISENNTPKLTFDLVIHNPNNWGVQLTDITTNVSVEDRFIGNTYLPNPIKIARKADILVPIQFTLSMADLISFLPQGLSLFTGKKTKIRTSVDGGITIKKFIFKKRIIINYKQDIELKK